MTNFARLHSMTKDKLSEELERIKIADTLPYVDMREWLSSDEPSLIPHGRQVIAEVLIRNNATRVIVGRDIIVCIIISDNQQLFGMRYYQVYDLADKKIKSIAFDSLEVVNYE